MAKTVEQPENFYTPTNFYNLQAAGISVWILCLVAGSILTDLTSFWFRIIAISFSFLISLSLFIKNKYGRNWYNYILIFVNACLIFVNASGFNSITYSYAFDNSRLKSKSDIVKSASFFNLQDQKDWWPDSKLLQEFDSVKKEKHRIEELNKELLNQFSFFKDWIQTNISHKPSRDTLKTFLNSLPLYSVESLDL